MTTLSSHSGGAGAGLGERLVASPELFPLALDPQADRVRFVPLAEADYEAASFLDARLGVPDSAGEWRAWAEVRAAAAPLPERCHFIFHASHVGSTLASRLVGAHPALFSLREPAALRTLAEAHLMLGHPACPWDRAAFDDHLGPLLALWSRTPSPGQTAVVKATSFASEMASDLMARLPEARALLMTVPPATFLRALLDGSMGDIAAAAGKRYVRLARRLGGLPQRLADLSPGECVAMSWLSEMLAMGAAASRFPGRALWVDFDRFLAAPEAGLAAILAHFGAPDAGRQAADICAGPALGRYAKAPDQRYDAATREQLLRQSEARHGPEVTRGLAWLDRVAAAPAVRAVLDRVAAQTKS